MSSGNVAQLSSSSSSPSSSSAHMSPNDVTHNDQPQSQPPSKKSRRAKPRLDLAPDQPLTTQGRPRARVYVACVQCRTRKIRCDGAKPACHNCTRRNKPSDPCVYDPVPKRRGPDRTPGARQRMARDAFQESDADPVPSRRRRRRKQSTPSPSPPPLPTSPSSLPPLVLDPQLADMPPFHSTPIDPSPLTASGSLTSIPLPVLPLYPTASTQGLHNTFAFTPHPDLYLPVNSLINPATTPAFISPYQDSEPDISEEPLRIASEPSLDFARQIWWDSLLAMYSCYSFPIHIHL
ncbi:hypothetical protein L210DRAFT_3643870 [Boletus edulis BED1]|uniref:Zn(2)-C6 fungal-type domain-containing protein n=1 Tax=Boletus edulis BED1 TaxID=1328754 RepID=A0AAD4GG42_BOLED|nr:hypothetical protein L210DRAFT_3643870 [Boletus edulis BED1]